MNYFVSMKPTSEKEQQQRRLTYLLTPKELEILSHLANGKLYKEVAEAQGIKIDTVKKHASTIYRKLRVRNKTEAILLFHAF